MITFEKFVRSKDQVAQIGFNQLHMRSNIDQKTFLGGLVSLGVQIYVLIFAF